MTVRNVDNEHWTGLSWDEKPPVATNSGVELDNISTETDIGKVYMAHDGTNWVGVPGEDAIVLKGVACIMHTGMESQATSRRIPLLPRGIRESTRWRGAC